MNASVPFAFAQNPLSPTEIIQITAKDITNNDRIIRFKDGKIQTIEDNPLLQSDQIEDDSKHELFTLGIFKNHRIIICLNSSMNEDNESLQWFNIRHLALNLPVDIASVCAHASAIASWHQNHQFCARCGSKTTLGKEHSRNCENDSCGHSQFPRIDPAVIMSVINDQDEILLGRQASWDENRFSVIAGFLSHGETLEQCVAREVKEETGVTIDSTKYIASQPWPFPGSIMIGFKASAKKQPVNTEDDELEEAFWISRDELQSKRQNKQIFISPKLSISRYLIDLWLEAK